MTLTPRDDSSIVELIPALRAFARTFYKDATDADDLVQETLIRALKGFDTFSSGTQLKSWMFTIMRNAFYTKIKLYRREAPGLADCVAIHPAVEATQEWSLRGKEVAAAVNRLPVRYREVLVLVAVLGTSYEEAAVIIGCAVGTIKSRLSRARLCVLKDLGERSTQSAVEPSQAFVAPIFVSDAGRQ
jgi:RNA polymerase sigma-70 factor (ECF subfamily)